MITNSGEEDNMVSNESQQDATHVFRLFVAGNSPRSNNAVRHMRDICETYLKGHYRLDIVDVYQQTGLARAEQIVATPTLIKYIPLPKRIWVGDLTNTDRVVASFSQAG